MNLRLEYTVDGEQRQIPLEGAELRLGRGSDNDILLPDFSVSRRHAKLLCEESEWTIEDLNSTNGVLLNGSTVRKARLQAGDCLTIGIFELRIAGPVSKEEISDTAIPNATIVRRLSDFSSELNVGMVSAILPLAPELEKVDESLPGVRSERFFEFLNRLARDLIHTDTSDEVLLRVMDIAFAALPVERGFILIGDRSGEVECRLARVGETVELRPEWEVPVSSTILKTVMEEQLGLLTLDALGDHRLQGGESIRLHGIRAAMCAPLWSGKRITGFIQVDSPFQAGSFTERDLDFLITLANYAAVGVQRVDERRLRGRLERYHSPSVLDELMREAQGAQAPRGLHKREVTILFADLVGFTAFSEQASLEEVADLLSGYCNRSVEAIFDQGGTLDKFIGDCVMAFFGAPMEQPDHALQGVRAALAIQRRMGEWNQERKQAGLPAVYCRVALNSGEVVVGDVGSEQRVDYTVLGNVVNVASRFESTVAEPGQVVIGKGTLERLGDAFETEALGEFALKGLQHKIPAFLVKGEREVASFTLPLTCRGEEGREEA